MLARFEQRLTGTFGLRRVGANLLWLVAEKGGRVLLGLGVGTLVARHLGPDGFGTLSFALAVAALAMVLADLGFDPLLKREIIAEPASAGRLLKQAVLSRVVVGGVVYAALTAAFAGFWQQPGREAVVVAGLLVFQPAGMSIAMWYHARLSARTVVMAQLAGLVVASAIRVWLVVKGAGVLAFVWCAVIESGLTILIVLVAFGRESERKVGTVAGASRGRIAFSEAWPLALSGIAVVVYMRVDAIMLKAMLGDTAVGVYSAAVRVSEVAYALPMAVASSLLPSLMEARKSGDEAYRERLQAYFNTSAILGVGCAVVVAGTAKVFVSTVYGQAYEPAGGILMVHAWAGLFVFLGVARSQWLVVEGMTRFTLLATILGAVVNLLLNLVLIPPFGGLGAAFATVVSYAVSAVGTSFLLPATRRIGFMQLRAMALPVTVLARRRVSVS